MQRIPTELTDRSVRQLTEAAGARTLFASELTPACGPGIRQGMGPVFTVWHKYLGAQWSIGDWPGVLEAFPREVPSVLPQDSAAMANPSEQPLIGDKPPQNIREYDPGRAHSCDRSPSHETVTTRACSPRCGCQSFSPTIKVDDETGLSSPAPSQTLQSRLARQLIEAAGQTFTHKSFLDLVDARRRPVTPPKRSSRAEDLARRGLPSMTRPRTADADVPRFKVLSRPDLGTTTG